MMSLCSREGVRRELIVPRKILRVSPTHLPRPTDLVPGVKWGISRSRRILSRDSLSRTGVADSDRNFELNFIMLYCLQVVLRSLDCLVLSCS
jgi:hypothetical protein